MESKSSNGLIADYSIKMYEDETIIEPIDGSTEITIIWINGMHFSAIMGTKFFFVGAGLKFPVNLLSLFLI